MIWWDWINKERKIEPFHPTAQKHWPVSGLHFPCVQLHFWVQSPKKPSSHCFSHLWPFQNEHNYFFLCKQKNQWKITLIARCAYALSSYRRALGSIAIAIVCAIFTVCQERTWSIAQTAAPSCLAITFTSPWMAALCCVPITLACGITIFTKFVIVTNSLSTIFTCPTFWAWASSVRWITLCPIQT